MIQSGLFMAAGQADLDLTEGPDAAPSSVSAYTYGGHKIGVQWMVGDENAETQVARTDSANDDPGTADVEFTAPPGATSWESGHDANQSVFRCTWWVRHVRNGQFSAWSPAGIHVDGCTPPTAPPGGEDGGVLI